MRPTHFLVAIVLVLALLGGVWVALQSEPVRAGESARGLAESARSDAPVIESADAALNAEERATSRSLPAVATDEQPTPPAARKRVNARPAVSGRVVDGEGRGVAGADVHASNGVDWAVFPLDIEPEVVPRNWLEIERVTTDADGRFTLRRLRAGSARVAVRASGFAPRAVDDVHVPDLEEHALPDIVLEPGVVLEGRVVDAAGRGVGGAQLLAAIDTSMTGHRVTLPGRGVPVAITDAAGAFRIDTLRPGPWELIVDSPDYLVSRATGSTARAGEHTRDLVLRVVAGAQIEGVVRWAQAPALGAFRISARPTREGESSPAPDEEESLDPLQSRPRHALVDPDGRFTLRGLTSGTRYRLTAWQELPGEARWKAYPALESTLAFAGERGVTISERPSTSLVFRAVDAESGAPVTTLTVSAGIGRERPLRDDKNEVRREFPDGVVRYPDLRAQAAGKPIVLRVSAPGYRDHERNDIAFTPGRTVDLGDVPLVRERGLVVTVLDAASGAPVEDARVFVATEPDETIANLVSAAHETSFYALPNARFGRTGPDGRVVLSSYPGRSIVARATARGFLATEPWRELLPADRDASIELRLQRGGVVVARVTDPTGRAVAGISIVHRPPAGSDASGVRGFTSAAERRTDGAGMARFDALSSDVHAFVACDGARAVRAAREGTTNDGWIEVSPVEGVESLVTFTVDPRARLRGVVREAGVPLALARVRLVEQRPASATEDEDGEDEDAALLATTDAEGRFTFESLRAASYDVFVAHGARRMPARLAVTLRGGDNLHDVDLDVAVVEGRVTDTDGEPIVGVSVSATLVAQAGDVGLYETEVREDDRGNPRFDTRPISRPHVKTDAQGRYALRGVASDTSIVVRVESEAVEAAESAPLSLARDEVARGVDFAVRRAGALEVSLVGDAPGGQREWFEVRLESVGSEARSSTHAVHLGHWQRTQKIPSLGPGRYRVKLFPVGNESSERAQAQEVEIAVGATVKVAFQAR